MDQKTADAATRILVFAPIGRDAVLTRDLLAQAGIASEVYASAQAMSAAVGHGAAAVILTEEILETGDFSSIAEAFRAQPPWSDIPVLLFTGGQFDGPSRRALGIVEQLPNVTLLDRPVRVAAAISLVRAAIRARARQLEVKSLLEALDAARQQAEAANRLKDEFLATLSHELRTPLNAILGWTAMLRNTPMDAAGMRRGLEVIDRNAHSQAQLVEDVLDMGRVITGKLRIDFVPVRLQHVVQAAVDALRPAADAKSIQLGVDRVDPHLTVRGDPDRLQQVLWNLLSNAVKFTPDGGRIDVHVQQSESYVLMTVCDSGAGIHPQFLPYVFDRFRQADQTVTRGHGGLGLGLAIVKHLVELHGGRVSVESRGLGEGATFTVRLPIPSILEEESHHVTGDDWSAIGLAGISVLVVDDDESTRELLQELLQRAHARVTVTATAAAALGSVVAEPPDVIVADIGLPGEDGRSLMRRIRALPSPGGDVPAVALSAYTRAQDRDAARAAGFTEFLGKPASPKAVLQVLARLVGK